MRRFYGLLCAVVLVLLLLTGLDCYILKKYKENHTIVILNPTTPMQMMSQETAIHLIYSSFRLITPQGTSGTGFAIWSGKRKDSSGDIQFYNYLITCSHVIKENHTVTVQQFHYFDQKMIYAVTSFEGTVVLNDKDHDLALLEVRTEEPFHNLVSFITPDDLNMIRLAEPVYTCGCGLGEPPYVANAGNIANFDRRGSLQITSPVIFGDSGGLVALSNGKIIGVASAMPWAIYSSQVYPEAGLAVPAWVVDIWLKINNYGFLNNAKDGTSLDLIFDQREQAKKDEELKLKEKSAKQSIDDILKQLEPPNLFKDIPEDLFPD